MIEPELLLAAYAQGAFPMAVEPRDEIAWFSPDPRAVIPLDERFHVSSRLARVVRRGSFEVTVDGEFEKVMRSCARRPEGTWISEEMVESYVRLHELGRAHSLEVWKGSLLTGGLYGVHLGAAFFGESMFHEVTDASKVALVKLVERLRERGFLLLDTQWLTPHLARFGAHEIPRREYLRRLRRALTVPRCFVP